MNTSAIKSKKKTAKCKEVIGMSQNLLPGRKCDSSNQCRSHTCYEKEVCKGTAVDKNCQTHEDCEPNNYCRGLDYWPFMTVCSEYKI